MAPLVTVFSQLPYEPLELVFNEATRHPAEKRNRKLVAKMRGKNAIVSFCEGTKRLMADAELWAILENTLTPCGTMRFRQSIIGNIIKGIFILHKDRAKRFYAFCAKRFLKAFRRPFNKELDEVIVLKKRIYPEIPIFKPPVRFHREYDAELWNQFYEDSRWFLQAEEERGIDSAEAIQADRQVGEVASIDVPMQEPPPVDQIVPMDIDRVVERDVDQLVTAGIRSPLTDLDQIYAVYPRENGVLAAHEDDSPPLTSAERQPLAVHVQVHAAEPIQDDRHVLEPTSMDHLITDLRPEVNSVPPEVDTVHPEMHMIRLEVDTVHPAADIVTTYAEEVQARTSPTNVIDIFPEVPPQDFELPVEVPSLQRPIDSLEAIQVDWRIEESMPRDPVIADLPTIQDLSIGSAPMELVSGVERDSEQLVPAGIRSDQPDLFHIAEETEPRARRTDVIDSSPGPVPQTVTEAVDVRFHERFLEFPGAIQSDRPADEVTSMDQLIMDLRPTEDADAPARMDVIEHEPNQFISVHVHPEQPDQIAAEIVQPPVEEVSVRSERGDEREAETNIQQLQKDFDRIELIGVDEIEVARVDDRPTLRPDQIEIPGIVVTELERTRTDSVVEPGVVPENGRAEEGMEVAPEPSREIRTIRISELMRQDATWEKARRKRVKKKIPIHFTYQQMKRMIDRPLVKCTDPPTLPAEVYAESRPNILSPLRLLLRETLDNHDVWEAPTNYAEELKKNPPRDCKFTLRQLVPFSHGIIFERLKPGFIGELSEKERKDQEIGKRALCTVANFSKILSPVILRFYGDESPIKTRPSYRHLAEDQHLDIPGMARKSSVVQPGESHKSLVPDAAVPPRPSIEPYLVGEVLDRTAQDESIIVPLPEQAHITFPEEELNQTGGIREPRPSAPVATLAVGEDLNRLKAVEEARLSLPAPRYLQTVPKQISSLPVAPEDVNRGEVIEDVTITMPTHTVAIQQPRPSVATYIAAPEDVNRIEVIEEVTITLPDRTMASVDSVHHPEAIRQPSPTVTAHIAAPEDMNLSEVAGESRFSAVIPENVLKHIVKSDICAKLESLLREKGGKITFLDLCPPPPEGKKPEECSPGSLMTRNQVAETLILLINLHVEKQVRLDYEVPENICASQIVIYSR